MGKATSLTHRVRSYFPSLPLPTSSSGRGRGIVLRPVEQMMHEVVDIRWKETDSVLEAIILEANEIKRLQPKYNVEGKDDKSWNYILITADEYPRVVTMREHEYERMQNGEWRMQNIGHVFGPYPGLNIREMLKILRRLFFVSDCAKRQSKQIRQSMQSRHVNKKLTLRTLLTLHTLPAPKPCLYYQMGQCLGVCTGEISPAEYRKKVIRPLVAFLKGGKKQVIVSLEKEMNRTSKDERFEEAGRLRNQIAGLRRVQDVALLNKSFVEGSREQAVGSSILIGRIEGYDISNLGSSGKVGSMVVFDQHGPVKSEYRKFKIKTVEGQSDVGSLTEMIERRLKHAEWQMPDVILVDGGVPQVNAAKKVLNTFNISIPVVGIAKGPERKRNDVHLGSRDRSFVRWIFSHQPLLIQVRDEAHRFAIGYQRKLRRLK